VTNSEQNGIMEKLRLNSLYLKLKEFKMSKKKDTEIEIIDTKTGVQVKSGKKIIAEINEENGNFVVLTSGKELTVTRNFADALEEAIKAYNLGA
jgi:transketolase